MGYIEDVIGLMSLKDDAYKRIGNDRNAFKRFLILYFMSFYGIEIFFGSIVAIMLFVIEQEAFAAIAKYWFISIGLFLVLPLLLLILTLILDIIPYGIGLLAGGKPKRYLDFFKIINYPSPIVTPIVLLYPKALSPIYSIWSYFILYKAYRIIQKLSPRKAGFAIVINIVLLLIFVFAFSILFAGFIATYPSVFLK